MNASPIQATAAAASVAILGLAAGAGLYEALVSGGTLPGVSLDYMPRIRALEAAGDLDGARRALRVATEVDAGNPGVARVLEQLAVRTGDLDDRVFALRALLRVSPFDADARVRLSRAFLERAASVPEPRARGFQSRAVWQADQAVRAEPASPAAHLALARALFALGEHQRAHAELAEARRLDPTLRGATLEEEPR